VGGISGGRDAHTTLNQGGKAVQIGSALMGGGPTVCAYIQHEFTAVRTMHETGA
jgi:dihydroorotate dehydrogenase